MIPRKANEGINTLPFYNGHPYTANGSLVGQCTWYAMGRCGELLGYPMNNWADMPQCSPNPCWNYTGVRDAKNWLDNTNWKISQNPVVGSVGVLDGVHGHVFVVEEEIGNGVFGISQYNKNSDKKFHYEEVNLNGSYLYGMKIKGFLIIPMEEIKRDESKWQVQVKVDKLRIRADHSTDSQVIGVCSNGALFNVEEAYNNDYRWLKIGVGWIGTTREWVDEYFPLIEDAQEKEIDVLNAELKERDKTILTLKDMNRALDNANKSLREENEMLQEKLDKVKEIINE